MLDSYNMLGRVPGIPGQISMQWSIETSFRNIALSLITLWIQIGGNDFILYTKSQNKYITLRMG